MYGEMGFTTKEKASSNLPTSSVNDKRTVTRVIRHSTRSFSIDLRNQENVVVIFQSVIKAKESEGKYSFGKNIIIIIFRLYP